MDDSNQNKTKDYQRAYYLKTREKRRNKIKCENCDRLVCSEYLHKHKTKLICKKHKEKQD